MTTAVLETGRLTLRPFAEGDAPFLFEMYSDPQTARYLSYPPFTEMGQAEAMVERILNAQAEERTVDRVIARKSDGAPVGSCTLFSWNKQCARAEIGYWTAPWSRRRGVATRGLTLMSRWALSALELDRLELYAEPANVASHGVATRAGFTRGDLVRGGITLRGRRRDVLRFVLHVAP